MHPAGAVDSHDAPGDDTSCDVDNTSSGAPSVGLGGGLGLCDVEKGYSLPAGEWATFFNPFLPGENNPITLVENILAALGPTPGREVMASIAEGLRVTPAALASMVMATKQERDALLTVWSQDAARASTWARKWKVDAIQHAVPFSHGTLPCDGDVLMFAKDGVDDLADDIADHDMMGVRIVSSETGSPIATGVSVHLHGNPEDHTETEVRLDSTKMRRAMIAAGPSFVDASLTHKFQTACLTGMSAVHALLEHDYGIAGTHVNGRMRITYNPGSSDAYVTQVTPLAWAIEGGHSSIFDALVRSPVCDVNKTNGDGHKPPLVLACNGVPGLYYLRALLNRKDIEVDIRTSSGATPLIYAASKGDIVSVQALLEAGADAENAVRAAVQGEHKEIEVLLRRALEEPTRDMVCANCGIRGTARTLAECYACRGPLYCSKACARGRTGRRTTSPSARRSPRRQRKRNVRRRRLSRNSCSCLRINLT